MGIFDKLKKPKKEYSEVYSISLDMVCTEDEVPSPELAISDDAILERVKNVKDIEEKDIYGRTLLINACFYGRLSTVEYLLSQGANVDATDINLYTPLHAAAQESHLEIMELLIKANADINAADSNGNTPLMVCVTKPPVRLLAKYGANADIKNIKGISARDVFQAYPDLLELF